MTAASASPIALLSSLALPTLDGGELRFADLRGRRLLLFMWGSW